MWPHPRRAPGTTQPPSSVRTLSSPECSRPGCLCLLPLRLCSGSPPLGSLSWLPQRPWVKVPPWVELGADTFFHGTGVWVASPCTVSPLQLRPPERCMEPVQKSQVAPVWTRRPFGGPGVPSRGGWFEAFAGPQRGPVCGGTGLRSLSGTQTRVIVLIKSLASLRIITHAFPLIEP